ncbi:MAG: hypothetical protein ACI3Y0_09875 [Prevotella sp.]
MKKQNSEQYQFRTLTGYDNIIIILSNTAGEWLSRTTRTNDGYIVSHRTLLNDLLSRMQLVAKESTGFRRPLMLNSGQLQYSELELQLEWNIGRKVIRRLLNEMQAVGLIEMNKSTIASTITFPFIYSWTVRGTVVENPYYNHRILDK